MKDFILLSEVSDEHNFNNYIKFIVSLEKKSFKDPWDEKTLYQLLQMSNYDVLILSDNDENIGYCAYSTVIDEAEILRIAISPEKRRKGYGDRLIEGFIERCELNFISDIFLEVRKNNLSARRLYEKNGFSEIAERKSYYGDGEDAVVYKKEKRIGEIK